jgi:outer membrane protein assembly factor BamB
MLRVIVIEVTVALLLLLSSYSAAGANPDPHYRLVKKIMLGGEGGWDYFDIDSATGRIFIPRRTHTMVVDPTGKVLGDLPIQGSHAVAFAPEFNRAFTSDNEQQTVTIINLTSLQLIGKIKLPNRNSDGILYDPSSKRVFTFNTDGGNDATAIDAATGRVLGDIPVGGKPEAAQADGTGRIYVNIEDRNQIVAFDSRKLTILNTWRLDPCDEPSGLAIDVVHKRLFAGCRNKMMVVVDYNSGKVVATVPIGEGVDADRFDPEKQLAFASCGDGTITVVHEDSPNKYTVVETVKTEPGARTMAIDLKNHKLYAVTAKLGPPVAETPGSRSRPTLIPNTFTLLIFTQQLSDR